MLKAKGRKTTTDNPADVLILGFSDNDLDVLRAGRALVISAEQMPELGWRDDQELVLFYAPTEESLEKRIAEKLMLPSPEITE